MTTPNNLAALTVKFFNGAAKDQELSERMAFAKTTVHIHFTDADESGCTVWLDRSPIGAEEGIVGDAEIELFAPSKVFMGLFTGKEQLPIAIVRGDVTYRGPVRKFLRVVPILTNFDFEMFKDDANGKATTPAPAPAPASAPTTATSIWETPGA